MKQALFGWEGFLLHSNSFVIILPNQLLNYLMKLSMQITAHFEVHNLIDNNVMELQSS